MQSMFNFKMRSLCMSRNRMHFDNVGNVYVEIDINWWTTLMLEGGAAI